MEKETKAIRALVFLGVVIGMILGAGTAFAADSCKTNPRDIYYSGRFTLSNALFRVIVQAPQRGGKTAVPVAHILNGKSCQATCQIRKLDRERTQPFAPIALEMECRGSGFTPLVTQATLLWPNHSQKRPELRFGSWLTGYRKAMLAVDLDRYSQVPARVIAQPRGITQLKEVALQK